eukprot:CAMPEP_0114350614 /NCGR_PEP_ID=MMETSP0101-20121206/16506_1 /TAXON_ID=38822 ORGANISM="Pteridomonas danica, Strain PT" /NCGR_SAMPLE_ID=MMETSP0101 /ASSEMBLY_ACC=CAM_ASM_000211 /LENGTH=804 /DNA_ID=CAMNT_0001489959 /DNA_START=620 /DNA_END=3034 /DNA_ORIENTATION=+
MVRTKGSTVTVGHARQPLVLEELTLTCWGRDASILISILNEALDDLQQEENDELNIWVLAQESWIGGWEKALSKKPREKDSVILDHNLADSLIKDARRFQQSVEWYSERGIPYRRGYILHGPPGTGKTSFCQVLAGELQLDMCMLTLADNNMSDSKLASSLRDAPKKAIIMIEDVDSIFVERKAVSNGGGKSEGGVTFSGLLNAIDGIASQEGRILIMTTNHLDRLDAALIRPGRCDVKAELTNASKDQAKQLFIRFFPHVTNTELPLIFMSKIPEYEVSMAALQGHLLQYRDHPEEAIIHVHEILKSHQSSSLTSTASLDHLSIFDHLRRVGLERFSYAFEAYGYFTKKDIENLSIDIIKSWIVELKYDSKSCDRFEKLLSLNHDIMREYMLCDIPTIKDLFWQTYSIHHKKQNGDDENMSAFEKDSLILSHRLHLKLPNRVKTDKELLEDLCQTLVPNGKGLASVWQLKWHLRVYGESALEMVNNAFLLVEPRQKMKLVHVKTIDLKHAPTTTTNPSKQPPNAKDITAMTTEVKTNNEKEDEKEGVMNTNQEVKISSDVGWMTAFQWCHRAGVSDFESCALTLEKKGYTRARDFQHLSDIKEITEIGFGAKHAKTAKVLIENRPENGQCHLLEGFKLLDFQHAKQEFLNHFSSFQATTTENSIKVSEKDAREFAHKITDRLGFGVVSLAACVKYFKKYDEIGFKLALVNVESELLTVTRPPPSVKPPAPEREDWVVGWLKQQKGLEQYITSFINQEILTKQDVLLPKPITEEQLSDVLGVKKLGHRKKLLLMINELLQESSE